MNSFSIHDASILLPSWETIARVYSLNGGYNTVLVMIGTTLLGTSGGILGAFSMLRKRSLITDVVAHCALLGLTVAYIIGVTFAGDGEKNFVLLLSGATISGILGILAIQFITDQSRITEDTAMALVLSVFFGAGIVLLSIIQNLGVGKSGGLQQYIYGQTAAISIEDAKLFLVVTGLILTLSIVLLKEFALLCFDRDFASSLGWNVILLDMVMMGAIIVLTVTGLQAVGLLLIVALLIIPPATARFWSHNLRTVLFLSAAIGGTCGYLGSGFSAMLPRIPAGAVIVLTGSSVFFISFLIAPNNGVIANMLKRLRLTQRIMSDHVLREIFELLEEKGDVTPSSKVPVSSLASIASKRSLYSTLWFLQRKRLVYLYQRSMVSLSERGIAEAKRLTRNHRLWEEYVITYGDLAVSTVDYSADLAEHVIGNEIVAELELSLYNKGLKLGSKELPSSVHAVIGNISNPVGKTVNETGGKIVQNTNTDTETGGERR